MHLIGQLPLELAQAQVVAQALVAELARLRVLVQAEVLELAQVQELELALQLEWEPPVVWVLEPPLVRVQGREPAWQQELAAAPEPRQAWKLRVSRQQEQQQHRLQAAAQELPPYRPALPMKAPY